jgi:hypothetical protein
MPREYIVKPLYWFQTHDNAVDEWWYGVYNTTHWFSFAREWGQAIMTTLGLLNIIAV